MRKFHHLKAALPEPILSVAHQKDGSLSWLDNDEEIDLLAVGWGSTKDVVHDVMSSEEFRDVRIAYLHYTYLWPLRTEKLENLAKRSKRIVLVEQNYQGQLGILIRMESGLDISDRILKYDGRPFFYDELLVVATRASSSTTSRGPSWSATVERRTDYPVARTGTGVVMNTELEITRAGSLRVLLGNQRHLVRRLRRLRHLDCGEVRARRTEATPVASVPLLRRRLPRQRF